MSLTATDDPRFKKWKKRVEANGSRVQNVNILGFVPRGEGRPIAIFIDCVLETAEGVEIPRYIVIRGDSVVIVPMLVCNETNTVYTMLVEQRRIVDGGITTEFPAGGVLGEAADLRLSASQEIREELSLTIPPDELIPLADKPIKINPSMSDDLVTFFYFRQEVTPAFLEEADGRATGCHAEGEFIRIKICPMATVARIPTSSTLIGIKLLEQKLNRVFN
jgi:8-oxo-dGTP pyrophosphatase MutT (NUDIX family)